MKPAFESLPANNQSSFTVRKFEEKRFSAPYHVHPEYELTLITSGNGKRYVGSNMSNFYPDDLVLLGKNLPHCWKTEPTNKKEKSGSIVIQFREDFLGADFFNKPELNRIVQLLRRSAAGIEFKGKTEFVKQNLQLLWQEKNAFKKLYLLLEVLHQLSKMRDYVLLDKQSVHTSFSFVEQERIHAATAYIVEHFQSAVSLSKVAALTNLTPQAFCKYFKKTTRKTFMEAVTDYRIDYALNQLINTEHSISQIAYSSGFDDISNFHKTFKKRMNQSPLQYRNQYIQRLEE